MFLVWILVGLVVAGIVAYNYPVTWNWLVKKGAETENKVTDAVKDQLDTKKTDDTAK